MTVKERGYQEITLVWNVIVGTSAWTKGRGEIRVVVVRGNETGAIVMDIEKGIEVNETAGEATDTENVSATEEKATADDELHFHSHRYAFVSILFLFFLSFRSPRSFIRFYHLALVVSLGKYYKDPFLYVVQWHAER
jgi:hypothetical protein